MLEALWLVPALPLLGFFILFVTSGRMPPRLVAAVGVGSAGLSALVALIVASAFLAAPPSEGAYRQELWRWITVGDFTPAVAFQLDALSLVMMLVVTFVGFLIHLYSSEFMAGDEGYSRFFAYMNLFVAAMLILVLADNLLLLYAGWEGVGLCSYLLIGFWYRDAANGEAARKAFVITRIGDTAMAIGLIYLFTSLGTLEIGPLMERAREEWPVGSGMATAAALLLLGGALGKSAQLPLQTWLPDAMAGPTPVSALIHAATMVTAGVYLVARTHPIYELAPAVQATVAVIGAATLLIAAFSALTQHDLKRILAYSTMSQIGYMFLALGVGAWSAAIFHLMTHAFFKALLFLAAGAVMMRLRDEHDIFRMGGLWRRLPVAFWSFLIGSAALAALPLVTAGFYSKDMILWAAWSAGPAGPVLWIAGFVGAFVTAIYIFRAVFIVFFGETRTAPSGRTGWRIVVPLTVLAVLSLVAGFLDMPPVLAEAQVLSHFLEPVLPLHTEIAADPAVEVAVMTVTSAAAVIGILLAFLLYLRGAPDPRAFARSAAARRLHALWLAGWGFDRLYDRAVVRPFLWLARVNRDDIVDAGYAGVALASRFGHALLSGTQTGQVRWYAGWVAGGSLAVIAIAVFA